MKKFFRENGLSTVVFILFLGTWIGQIFTGISAYNEDLELHGQLPVALLDYLKSGHFIEATFENWESEFLQMAIFVYITACLYQRGSSESNPLPEENAPEKKYKKRYFLDQPILRKLYENSLSLALLLLFIFSFCGHLYGGWAQENLHRAISPKHQGPASLLEFAGSSNFWFQSFQNWQSEFFSIGLVVIFSIYLRQKDSAQSKEVDAPHWETKF